MGLLGVKGCLEKVCFEMSFKFGKSLLVTSDIIGIPDSINLKE